VIVRIRFDNGHRAGEIVDVGDKTVTIGRAADCALTLTDAKASARHASLQRREDGTLVLRDLGSTNGTFVDGVRISSPVVLAGNELVRIGDTTMTVLTDDVPTVVAARPPAPAVHEGRPPPRPERAEPLKPAGAAPGAPVAIPPASRSASMIERIKLRRAVNRAMVVAGVAVIAAVAVGVLLAAGVFEGARRPTVSDVARTASPSVLLVIAEVKGVPHERGTGWVLDATQGLVVTNNHVLQGGDTVIVGKGATRAGTAMRASAAQRIAAAPCEDIAVIRVSDVTGLKALPLATAVSAGDPVVGLGFPLDASLSAPLVVTSGVVSVPRTEYSPASTNAPDVPFLPNVVQTDTTINPGNSGGPLVNFGGQVVGMNTATLTSVGGRAVQGSNYSIRFDELRKVTDQLRAGRSIGWAGFEFTYADPAKLRQLGYPPGLIVTSAESGSPASQVPIFSSGPTLLTAINGHALDTTLKSYCDAVKDISSGQTVPLTVYTRPRSAPDVVNVTFG
jgi:S1-C subfamily serine protease